MSEITQKEINSLTKEENYLRGYKDGKDDANNAIVPAINEIHGGVYKEGQRKILQDIQKILLDPNICRICNNEKMDCCDCEIFEVENYIRQTLRTLEKPKKCKDCKWLDLEDKTTIGYKCDRPNHYWRSKTSMRKYKHTPACRAFEKKED